MGLKQASSSPSNTWLGGEISEPHFAIVAHVLKSQYETMFDRNDATIALERRCGGENRAARRAREPVGTCPTEIPGHEDAR
jgi:hypothetical protein